MEVVTVDSYIESCKQNSINTILEFLGTETLTEEMKLKTEELAIKRRTEVEDAFINGVDASRGLISHIVKVDSIVLKDGDYYFTVKQGKKTFLLDLKSLL